MKSNLWLVSFLLDWGYRCLDSRWLNYEEKLLIEALWRWLSEDAIKPWRYRSWIFPRDTKFREKANHVLSLYEGLWDDRPLGSNEFVLSADEKTSIQARQRRRTTKGPRSHQNMLVEHEYKRQGAWAYLAAWDVRRAKVFGRCESRSGIASFDRLVGQVMCQEPYCSAECVFWIVDNGSSHRGEKACAKLKAQWPTIELVHLPVHASWLNQIEIYFSVVERKVLTPNDFSSLLELEERLLGWVFFLSSSKERRKPLSKVA